MTSSLSLRKWLREVLPETKCICCKVEYYEFQYSCSRVSQGFTEEKILVNGLIQTGALDGGKTLFRQKRDYCHYGGPPRDYSIEDAKTLMEQQRAGLKKEENRSSDEARSSSSDNVTETSSEVSSSTKSESESSDSNRSKLLEAIYQNLADSAEDFEKSPNKDFEKTLAVLDDDEEDAISVNTEMVVEDLYDYFDSQMCCIDNFSQMDLSEDVNEFDGEYSELFPAHLPELSSDDVSEALASIETSIVDSNTLKRDLAVSSTTTESASCKKVKLEETEQEFPQPGASSSSEI